VDLERGEAGQRGYNAWKEIVTKKEVEM